MVSRRNFFGNFGLTFVGSLLGLSATAGSKEEQKQMSAKKGRALAENTIEKDYDKSNTRDVYLPEGKWIDYDNGKVYKGPTTLKDFPIPVDKTPLLVGGSGFVVEKREGKLYGRIYPVDFEGKTVFYDKDAQTKSEIRIENFKDKEPVIQDQTAGKNVPVRLNGYAWQFEFIPGHDYLIK